MARKTKKGPKSVETLTHAEASRKNIPTAELQSLAQRMEETDPVKPVTYERASPLANGETRPRDADLDPQIVWKGATLRLNPEQIAQLSNTGTLEIGDAELVWRGKDQQDWSDLVVQAPPLYIQEKIHPKALIEDLKKQTKQRQEADAGEPAMFDLFGDFNGIDVEAKTEFYQHDQNWQNRMILGDSLQVMASLGEREALRGKVQCIYFDPPYGIKFNSNWQVSTRSRDVKDGKMDQISREAEQVKAFRDTWKDGIHSYLTYLRDRLTAMRDLLTDSGSIFVQIGDENVHRVRGLMDEVFGEANYVNTIYFSTTGGFAQSGLSRIGDNIIWYSKNKKQMKFHRLYGSKKGHLDEGTAYTNVELDDGKRLKLSKEQKASNQNLPKNCKIFSNDNLVGQGPPPTPTPFSINGKEYLPTRNSHWKASYPIGMARLGKASRVNVVGSTPRYVRYFQDKEFAPINNTWLDTGHAGFAANKQYIVETNTLVVQRCILMTTDPGDLVLDPTCGSGTTAMAAEQWGRRWITIDTSRVSLALARARLMGARYPYYFLSDSQEGREKEQDVTGKVQSDTKTYNDIRQGFVYERAPHIMLKTIANNAEIDVIWDNYQEKLEPLRAQLNEALNEAWQDWEIPREAGGDWPADAAQRHRDWWALRIKRQQEIDKSIAQKADVEYLYDRPYEDPSKVRVAGPFTVESLSPHRVIPAEEDELIHDMDAADGKRVRQAKDSPLHDFAAMVMENLKSAGVHQAAKADRINFMTMDGWPGIYIAAEGRYMAKDTRTDPRTEAATDPRTDEATNTEKRAAIFIGPEFGTVTCADLTAAAREAYGARFDTLIACGFNFDAHTSELSKLGPLSILQAKMNPDLHMSDELKNTGAGNLFVVFGEPDVVWDTDKDGNITVEVLGIDVFDPKTGDVRASGKNDIAAWFIDTDYNEESFFVRHAYFLGANDPYKALKTSLKAEIDREAWETLYRDTSRPFTRPSTGRFAVKVINHFGDEVMKVFGV